MQVLEYNADTMFNYRRGISVQEDKLSFARAIQEVPLVNWSSDVSLVRSTREVHTFLPFPRLQHCPSFIEVLCRHAHSVNKYLMQLSSSLFINGL